MVDESSIQCNIDWPNGTSDIIFEVLISLGDRVSVGDLVLVMYLKPEGHSKTSTDILNYFLIRSASKQ